MTEISNLAPIMFGSLVLAMLLGFPVAFTLGGLGLGFGYYAMSQGLFNEAFMGNLPLRLFGIVSNELLLSIPFFTFMGAILERCGLAEDLLEGTGQLFGGKPGGLGFAVIIVGAILGAITGTVAASVIAMGVISLPIMVRYGYDMRYATGVIAASGTITQLIPPSLVLVVLADQLGRSVGDMYLGAIGPSLLQTAIFLLFTLGVALLRPQWVPPLPEEARTVRGWPLLKRVLWGMLPSIVLIFLVLGTLFMGLATPTEAGALGAIGGMVLAALHKRLSWSLVWQAMDSTMRVTAMVIFILLGSSVFSLVFQGVDGNLWIEHLLTNLPGGALGFLIVVNLFVFFLAFFLDFFEIAFIVVPLLAPVAQKLGIDLVWFGVLLCVNMQTSFMHPPFGFALFYLRGVADQIHKSGAIAKPIQSKDIYLGAIPWVLMQLSLVAMVIFWPESVTYWLDKEAVVNTDEVHIEMKIDDTGAPEDVPAEVPVEVPSAPEAQGDSDPAQAVKDALKAR
ncbi:tripartite ATP-independent transporter DctM subunit [Aquabacterium commune]|uniref:TRAP transporter large permease protein n=2 Tax=Aquabacterium commune TaxID=70586 RepID=A0A4R6R893_9BURK|nr:tripartite ATP-independent transporter DctM subunit [Aquabacterium commune]